MEQIQLSLPDGTSYPIRIERGLLDHCGTILREMMPPCRVMLISDDNVARHYLDRVMMSLAQAGFTTTDLVMAPGEPTKSAKCLSAVWEAMADGRLTRTDLAISLGGGVIGDLTGFAAGCYLRGIRFVQIPTTLLAAVDASVGGKTAVNLAHGKNLAGLFHQPCAVLCDPDTLATLPPLCLADGAAEAIKTGILGDPDLFAIFEQGNPEECYTQIIAKSVQYKAKIVAEDPTEHGARKLLNLGHTAGHAIELASGFEITHGHAVAIGMAMMTRAAAKRGILPHETAVRILEALTRNHLPIDTAYSPRELAEIAQTDKKAAAASITVILPEEIGRCRMEKIPLTALEALFADGMGALA